MDESNIPVLVDAKSEYTRQLIDILSGSLYSKIKQIYLESKNICIEESKNEEILMVFQNNLSNIPKWNQEIINSNYDEIKENSGCDYLEELLTAIIVCHTKVLTTIGAGSANKKINIIIPKIENFIHKTYIQLAREFWKNPYLLDDEISNCDYQRNIRECEKIICDTIHETIRKQLPVKHILKKYLGESYEETETSNEDITQKMSDKDKNNIKKLIDHLNK